jgi:arylsulfatase A-like enzyme
MYGWKHRAINQGGMVIPRHASTNLYSLLDASYYKFAFCQNPWADRLVAQNYQDVDKLLSPAAYSLHENNFPVDFFKKDRAIESVAVDDLLFPKEGDLMGSAVLGPYYKYLSESALDKTRAALTQYPHGAPQMLIQGFKTPYLNEELYHGVYLELSKLASASSPYLAYFHLLSPHFPYRPRQKYMKLFRGEPFKPPSKPMHPLALNYTEDYISTRRMLYDRQIAQVDHEFGLLVSQLEKTGTLENTYLIFTADHGELFERGFFGHGRQLMYEGVLNIPMIIRAPGQSARKDVFSPTSIVDLLPTLLHLAGQEIPAEIDGKLLPGFGGFEENDRPIFAVYGVDNPAFTPLKKCVVAMRKGAYKLLVYLGYENFDQVFELYNLSEDPEELVDLSAKEVTVLSALKQEFFTHLEIANSPFVK